MTALQRGRRVVAVVDDFVEHGGCAAEFLGRAVRVSMRAAQLAARADVPLVPVTLSFRQGRIWVKFGSPFASGHSREDKERATQRLLAGLARRTSLRPAEWNDLFEFFEVRRS